MAAAQVGEPVPGEHALGGHDQSTRQRIATLTGHRQPVLALAFSPDGKSLVSTGGNQGVPGDG